MRFEPVTVELPEKKGLGWDGFTSNSLQICKMLIHGLLKLSLYTFKEEENH